MALGRATLDIERLRHSDFVLTTYDTLRDHQFSFAKVRFRVVIFDEAQKIKSGTSLINHAAKAQQPDFVILVTGTPVENSTMDMWTLLDVAWPGFLGLSGKDFADRYGDGSDADLMETLKERLIRPQIWGAGESAVTTPPVMLRRFKADILEGLPAKEERPWQEQMPVEQARAYDAIIASMQTGDLHPLEALQQLRRICLHPNLHVACNPADRQQVINTSARFRILFRILREAYEAGAGVLVFVDILKAQDVLQPMIRDEFGMQHLPQIINGQTNLRAVGAIKRRFQEGRGFDVLLLGPRAAGFGLNLTRATYVVHLNRWWNPAVEDQCSDRAHRIGQTRLVTVHLPIAVHPRLGEQSFDLVLHGLLTRKRTLSRQIVVPSSISQRELTDLVAQIAAAGGALDKELLDALDTRDWRGFEIWVLGRFQVAGWQVSETPRSGDGGVDLIARHPTGRRPVVIQVKHRAMGSRTVGESAVREVADAPERYQRSHPWLTNPILLAVTNGIFDLAARTLATQRGVRIVDRTGIIGLDGIARELFRTEQSVDRVGTVSSPTQKPHTGLKELDARIEAIELQIRALITSTLGGDPNRLPPHINQKVDERLASAAKKNVTINLKEYRRLPHKLEFCDLRELADSIVNKSLWPEFQPLFVNKETFLGKFDQLAELRNGIRHSRTIDAIVHMEGEAGILWFENVLRKEE
jgi:HJR/Mrr/RecB family endonuclease